jgi:hypothetical protein
MERFRLLTTFVPGARTAAIWIGMIWIGIIASQAAGEGRENSALMYPLEGEPFLAEFERVSSRGVLNFRGPGEEWGMDRFFQWGAPRENLVQPQLILADGGTLVADLVEIREHTVRVGFPPDAFFPTTIWQSGTLPRSMIRAILFRPPADDHERDRLVGKLRDSRESDVAWLDNGDVLRGEFLGPDRAEDLADPSQPWQWRIGGSPLVIDRSRVIAMAWTQERFPEATDDSLRMNLGFRDGSLLRVLTIERNDRQTGSRPKILLKLGSDAEVSTDESTFGRQFCFLQPANERIRFLSDLPPLGFRHVPTFALTWPLGKDRNVLGGRLRYGDYWSEKGLGTHSVSRVAYEVPEGAERFQSELVLDQSVGKEGSVQGRVYIQGGESDWKLVAESPVLRGGDIPWHFNVPLVDAERLALITDQADRGSLRDRANWLHARFVVTP